MKLIDGDELIELLLSTAITDKQREYSECVQYAVQKMPTVDAVPVVRCKDCTRWRKYNGEQFGECKWTFRVTKADGYCDDAERKDGGNG